MKYKKIVEIRKMIVECGYQSVRYRKKYNGHELIEPIFTDGIVRFIGLPQYVLAKNGEVRWATIEECEDIFNHIEKYPIIHG